MKPMMHRTGQRAAVATEIVSLMIGMQRSAYDARLMYGAVIVGVARTMIDTASKDHEEMMGA